MSASFEVQSSTGSYQVHVECGILSRTVSTFSESALIADRFFFDKLQAGKANSVFIEAIEANKSLEAIPALIEKMRRHGMNRQTALVALGGGILQDIAAFIASVYMRGLRWTYVPTTVLAMVDSCIGGKSSINVGPYKNLVGTFHPPERVVIDPEVIATLPKDQRASGLIEAAKICFCRGEDAFRRHLSYQPAVTMSSSALEKVVINSLQSKKWFIEIDEFDKKERLLLNFGHTFGHAMEGATYFAIAHGIAVGLGMICALEFERIRGTDYLGTENVHALETHLDAMIKTSPSVAETLRLMSLEDVIERFNSDKKHGKDFYTLILVSQAGQVELQRVEKSEKSLKRVKQAVQRMIERYT